MVIEKQNKNPKTLGGEKSHLSSLFPRLISLQTSLPACYCCRPRWVLSVRQQAVRGLGLGCSAFSLLPLVCHSFPVLWCWSPMGCTASRGVPALHHAAPPTPLTVLFSDSLCCFLLCSLYFSPSSIFYPSLNKFSLRCHRFYWWAQLCHVVGPPWTWLNPAVTGMRQPLTTSCPAAPTATKTCHLHPIQLSYLHYFLHRLVLCGCFYPWVCLILFPRLLWGECDYWKKARSLSLSPIQIIAGNFCHSVSLLDCKCEFLGNSWLQGECRVLTALCSHFSECALHGLPRLQELIM